jgi:Carboxypeptidase regulatory-like domain/Putative binding domain, N-terminal
MSPPSVIRHATAAILVAALMACGGNTTPTAPTTPSPPPTPHPSVNIAAVSVAGERRTTGYMYRTVVQLRESAGTAATIVSIDLTFVSGTTSIASSHYDQPIGEGTSVCPASGTIATRELVTVDSDTSHPYATTIEVKVAFTDGAAYTSAASGAAGVPPLPAPQTHTLTGRITDADAHTGIESARLQVLGGLNAGRTATTDRTGTYVMTDLLADTFRLRASADGYVSGEQGVTVPDVPRADFELRRVVEIQCGYTITPPAVAMSWPDGNFSVTITRTSGTCPWQAASSVNWITFPGGASGNGSATLASSVAANTTLNSRSGTITISWTGGSALVNVQQGTHPDWVCRPVTLTKGSEDFDNVPSSGGTLTVLASAPADPAVWSSACRATVHSYTSWIIGGGTVDGHAGFTFTVAANPSPGTPRTGSIVAEGPGGTATLVVTQR